MNFVKKIHTKHLHIIYQKQNSKRKTKLKNTKIQQPTQKQSKNETNTLFTIYTQKSS